MGHSDRLDLLPDGTYTRLTLDGRDLGRWEFRELTDTDLAARWPWLVVLRPESSGEGACTRRGLVVFDQLEQDPSKSGNDYPEDESYLLRSGRHFTLAEQRVPE